MLACVYAPPFNDDRDMVVFNNSDYLVSLKLAGWRLLCRRGEGGGFVSWSSDGGDPISHHHFNLFRPEIRRGYPLNLSILLSGGKENNNDSLSNGE